MVGSRPVAGRPTFFFDFGLTFIDFAIFLVYQNSTQGTSGRGLTFSTAPHGPDLQ
jgi:hypothetical protein